MPTTNWLVDAITEAIDTTSEQAMSATSNQRVSFRACLDALNGLLGLVLSQDVAPVFTMADLVTQIEDDLSTHPTGTATRAHLEEIVQRLYAWVERAIPTWNLEQPS